MELFFERLRERVELLADGLHGGVNGVITDMLSEEVKTHLADPGQWYKLLGIQIGQPGEEVRPVLNRGGDADRPWGMEQLSGNGAAFDFDAVFRAHEFLRRQIAYLAGFIVQNRLFAEIAATSTRATCKGMNLDVVWFLDRFERGSRMSWLAAGFFAGFAAQAFWLGFAIAVLRWRLAAVAAGESQPFLKIEAVCDKAVKIPLAPVAQFSGGLHGRGVPETGVSRDRGRCL